MTTLARPRITGPRLTRLLALAVLVAALPGAGPARAATSTDSNTWTYTMTNPSADGLVINGTTGTNNPLIIKDHLGQPITAVGEDGGLKVFGDNLAVNAGSDIYHSQVTMSPSNPVAAVCVRSGQLWMGGPDGHVWRCADLDGGTWTGGWWQVF